MLCCQNLFGGVIWSSDSRVTRRSSSQTCYWPDGATFDISGTVLHYNLKNMSRATPKANSITNLTFVLRISEQIPTLCLHQRQRCPNSRYFVLTCDTDLNLSQQKPESSSLNQDITSNAEAVNLLKIFEIRHVVCRHTIVQHNSIYISVCFFCVYTVKRDYFKMLYRDF